MFGKKKSKSKEENSSHYSLRGERKQKIAQSNNHSAEYLCKNTSSSESLDNAFSSYKLKGRKGFSLDRNHDSEVKPQMKPKRSSWFLRDKNKDRHGKNEKFPKRSSLDFSVTFEVNKPQIEKTRSKPKTILRQNAADAGDSSTTPQEEVPEPIKKLTKFQIGKRFLKGEIGIRSFNYYLLKESLKKSSGKQKQDKPSYMSKSEENIYEEIFFYHDQSRPKPQVPPALPPLNKHASTSISASSLNYNQTSAPPSDHRNILNCDICIQESQHEKKHVLCSTQSCDKCLEHHQKQNLMTHALSESEGYGEESRKSRTISDFFQQQNQGQTVLHFQSYNPNNPKIYKLETTPVAFDYSPVEEQAKITQKQNQQKNQINDEKNLTKSSSSSDSLKGQQQQNHQNFQAQTNEFYTRPNYIYPLINNDQLSIKTKESKLYRTDSSTSLRSETSVNNKIYNSKNSSQKSNQSPRNESSSVINNVNREETLIRTDMSDSSLGDSLFSSDANKRYFGSSESCRFNYESRRRRRCSLENENCSFSDTCRYECNFKNCDCSSSYFSSDFDDTNNNNSKNNIITNNNGSFRSYKKNQCNSSSNNNNNTKLRIVDNVYAEPKSPNNVHYAEDFIKHVINVKRGNQNVSNNTDLNEKLSTQSIYEVPKSNSERLDVESIRNNNGELCDSHKNIKTGYYIMSNQDELTITIKENMGTESAHFGQKSDRGIENNYMTGTVPKSSISSIESKKSSTHLSQQHCKEYVKLQKQKNTIVDTSYKSTNNENMLQVTQRTENLLEKEKNMLILSNFNIKTKNTTKEREQKILPVTQDMKITGKDEEAQSEQLTQPEIEILNDDDDEVFFEKEVLDKNKDSLSFF